MFWVCYLNGVRVAFPCEHGGHEACFCFDPSCSMCAMASGYSLRNHAMTFIFVWFNMSWAILSFTTGATLGPFFFMAVVQSPLFSDIFFGTSSCTYITWCLLGLVRLTCRRHRLYLPFFPMTIPSVFDSEGPSSKQLSFVNRTLFPFAVSYDSAIRTLPDVGATSAVKCIAFVPTAIFSFCLHVWCSGFVRWLFSLVNYVLLHCWICLVL